MGWPLLVGDDTVDVAAAATDCPLLRLYIQDMRTRRPSPSAAVEFVIDCTLDEPEAEIAKRAIFGFAGLYDPWDQWDHGLVALVRARDLYGSLARAERSEFARRLGSKARLGIDALGGRTSRLMEGVLNYLVLARFPNGGDDDAFTALSLLFQCCVVRALGGRITWFVNELLRLRFT